MGKAGDQDLQDDDVRRGHVDRSRVPHLHQHELDTANRLANLGEDVRFIPSGHSPRPDAELSDGKQYEFKSPTGSSRKTTLDRIKRAAARGKENFVLDLARSDMSVEQARDLARYAVDTYPEVQTIRIIGRDTPVGPLDVTIKKGGG
ncbi:hypothetical protein [Mycobacterium talmoniae]|uniref:tRNA nuclease CdiA C-terminal domain-containing protein n=1 Tax=Mycobacterium talmoniae TaxID=1858794 RepID=A0A1S1NE06_9MYCO|nr:hypothetical protein [Mycobacterium talmoniae]OHV03861.1 hypothetical protein BKN37_12895 [Mycobacterium talmoniae]PQM45018.1 hypothetical protein C1Y40_04826 [Mycobacterium talmoniae]